MSSRFSVQRSKVYQAVVSNKVHPTAEFIYHYLKPDNPALSLGTVYRNLQYLTDNGLINKLTFQGDVDRYDAELDRHYHAICEKCGTIKDIYIDYMSGIDIEVESKSGFKVTDHKIIFNIVCDDCLIKS